MGTFTKDMNSLDDVVTKFKAFDEDTECAQKMLMATITLRERSGPNRKQAVRSMVATWNVARYEKVADKLKDRSVSTMARDIEAAVCDAALKLESNPRGAAAHVDTPPREGSQSIDARSHSTVGDDVAVKKKNNHREKGMIEDNRL